MTNRTTGLRSLAALLFLGAVTACGNLTGGGGEATVATAAIPVVRIDLEISVRATGELEAENASPIAVPRVPTGAMSVKEVAAEGSIVEEGDVILVFDDSQLNIELDNHMATFRSTGRRVDRTRIDWGIEEGSIGAMRGVAELELGFASEFQLEDESIYSQLEILETTLKKDYADEKILFADGKLLLKGEYYDIDERILNVEKGQVQGKVFIDVSVPLDPENPRHMKMPAAGSATEEAQKFLGPGTKVVAAFQNVAAHLLRHPDHPIDCDVMICGNDKDARKTVSELVAKMGFKVHDVGTADSARVVEGMTSILIRLNIRNKVKAGGIRLTGLPG